MATDSVQSVIGDRDLIIETGRLAEQGTRLGEREAFETLSLASTRA